MNKVEFGKYGERKAAEYLEEKGYRILERNCFTPYGEIDLVAVNSGEQIREYIFVEVKTRSFQPDGNPSESITEEKQAHMVDSAMHYVQTIVQSRVNWRIDVITVEVFADDFFRISHYENALFE